MKEMIESFRAEVERTEAAHLRFITMRTVEARNLLDMLEQTSRAQRTDEGECKSAAAPAAGQAGLAKLLEDLTRPYGVFDVALHACHRDNVQDFLALLRQTKDARESLAAPVAADTEQATDEQLAKDAARYRWLRHADLDALAAGNWGTGQVCEGVKFDDAIDRAMDATPLATPADAGAGQIDERAELEKEMGQHYADLERTKDGVYHWATTRTAWLAWQARARLSTPGAPVTAEPVAYMYEWIGEPTGLRKTGEVIARTIVELGGNIDLYPHNWKRIGALYAAPVSTPAPLASIAGRTISEWYTAYCEKSAALEQADACIERYKALAQSPAPVTAEPVQSIDTPEFQSLLNDFTETARAPYGLESVWNAKRDDLIAYIDRHIATHPAPADRDAIRDEVLDEVADKIDAMNDSAGDRAAYENRDMLCCEEARMWTLKDCASGIRALKSMERAAGAKGEQQ